jgi:acyl carrier protein
LSDVTALIREVLHEVGREAPVVILPEMRLRQDLGFDSLELAILTVKIEAEYGVDVFAQGVVHTVGEVLQRVHP